MSFPALKKSFPICAFLLAAAPVVAENTQPYTSYVPIRPYTAVSENYCPAGTQPVVYLDGVSCGVVSSAPSAPIVASGPVAVPAAPIAPLPQGGDEFVLGADLPK